MPTLMERSSTDRENWIASITYRSEAVSPPSLTELQQLLATAGMRNRSVGITGLLLHDGGRCLQTIEGPPESMDQIWSSIQRDRRHGAIKVLSQHIIPARLFSEWDLQLYNRGGGRTIAASST